MRGLVIVFLLFLCSTQSFGETNVTSSSIDVINVEACTKEVLVSGIKLTAFANDSRKYVECVGIGLGVERSCVIGSVFDIDKMGCVLDEATLFSNPESNSTSTTEAPMNTTEKVVSSQVRAISTVDHVDERDEQILKVVPRVVPDFVVIKNETVCRNGGETHGNSSHCVCLADFTGANCEIEMHRSSNWSVVGHLLNDTFDYEVYSRLNLSNQSSSHRLEDENDYEAIVDDLIDSIWTELSGEGAYIHGFNYSSLLNHTHNLGRRLHRLSLYARQDAFSFELNFKLYVKSLDKLGDYLEANATVRSDAARFTTEWIRANNLTAAVENKNEANVTESRRLKASILCRTAMSRIEEQLNVTRDVASQFYSAYLNRSQVNFDLDNFTHVLANLTERNWNAIVNYGFWRVTRRLSGIEHFGEFGSPVVVRKRSVRDRDDDSATFNESQTDVDLSLRAFVDSKSFDRRFSPKALKKLLADSDNKNFFYN